MSKRYLKSEANRVLSAWARNKKAWIVNLGSSGVNLDGDGGGGYTDDNYSPEEKLCLNEMLLIQNNHADIYSVAELEYLDQAVWWATCRKHGGWFDIYMNKHKVKEPSRKDYLNYVHQAKGINETTYYRRLTAIQERVYENVVMYAS